MTGITGAAAQPQAVKTTSLKVFDLQSSLPFQLFLNSMLTIRSVAC
ncbi:hypothetical protein ACINLE_05220 [Bacillus sp. z60-18]